MVQDTQRQQEISIYEINNKKYTVITRCIQNCEDFNKIYDVLAKFIIDKLEDV